MNDKRDLEIVIAYTFTSRSGVTERLPYQIFKLSKAAEKLKFRIRGNIYSSGHHQPD